MFETNLPKSTNSVYSRHSTTMEMENNSEQTNKQSISRKKQFAKYYSTTAYFLELPMYFSSVSVVRTAEAIKTCVSGSLS